MLQAHLSFVVRVTVPEACDVDLKFHVELKSNVYGDVLLKSQSIDLRFRRDANATEEKPTYPRTEVLLWHYAPQCPEEKVILR